MYHAFMQLRPPKINGCKAKSPDRNQQYSGPSGGSGHHSSVPFSGPPFIAAAIGTSQQLTVPDGGTARCRSDEVNEGGAGQDPTLDRHPVAYQTGPAVTKLEVMNDTGKLPVSGSLAAMKQPEAGSILKPSRPIAPPPPTPLAAAELTNSKRSPADSAPLPPPSAAAAIIQTPAGVNN